MQQIEKQLKYKQSLQQILCDFYPLYDKHVELYKYAFSWAFAKTLVQLLSNLHSFSFFFLMNHKIVPIL